MSISLSDALVQKELIRTILDYALNITILGKMDIYRLWSLAKARHTHNIASKNYDKAQMPRFFKAFISETDDLELLNELEEVIRNRKAQL